MNNMVGQEVTTTCLKCLNDGSILEAMNSTQIVLIPKKAKLCRIYDLRPIALCNVLYKVLANKLKFVLPVVISETQSALFMTG